MAAPKGNRFWEARSSHGRRPIFESADALLEACLEYFEWVEQNPLWEDKIISFQGAATHVDVAKMRAMTISGLCIFLDVARRTWDDYRAREDFLPVCNHVEQIIRDQKFTGAAADLLNANIIARDLGLADKTELTGREGGPIETRELSETEAARRIAFTLAKATQG
ncbi:DNA-packaging protein [Bradyrhizobium sp. 197]|uniref:DNA-packaging protein n=1 Tax=Bradyrhizobium sp. 197 TaxID=2782663 RepID=UPI001FF765DE|nr:DNA-packaging protein [Bradyrhizobium sp. 197]MCK1479314.1 DNA-packaging protein [Bradyrhizobium sp. 197]